MHTFEVRLFGELRILRKGTPLPPPPTRAAGEILAFLLINRGRPVARDRLAAELWGERSDERARKALRTGLWRVRTHLDPSRTTPASADSANPVVSAAHEMVELQNPRDWWVDLWTFEDVVQRTCGGGVVANVDQADELRAALDLHPRPFLESHDARWCESRRERTRLLWLSGMECLVAWYRSSGEATRGLLVAQQVLQVAPLRETMHREIMAMHYQRGDRPTALLQYERCREVLRDELGVPPMAATRALRDVILQGGVLASVLPVD